MAFGVPQLAGEASDNWHRSFEGVGVIDVSAGGVFPANGSGGGTHSRRNVINDHGWVTAEHGIGRRAYGRDTLAHGMETNASD